MADPDFFGGLFLGAVLLGGVFVSVYVGFFLVPAFWILLLCGWPLIIVTVAAYELMKRASRSEVMRGTVLRLRPPPREKFCAWCGTIVDINATDCPVCGLMLLPTYDKHTPPPKFCAACGAPLQRASRYGRGWCPRCEEYR